MPFRYFILLLLLCCSSSLVSQAMPEKYGLAYSLDSLETEQRINQLMDSMIETVHSVKKGQVEYAILSKRIPQDKTYDFYMLLALVLAVGLLKMIDPRFFFSTIRAFRNPVAGISRLKDQENAGSVSNAILVILFAFSLALFLSHLIEFSNLSSPSMMHSKWLFAILAPLILLVYFVKYITIHFSGFIFGAKEVADQYLFNVFLVNKIIGLALIPFTILLAFLPEAFRSSIVLIALIVVGVLVLNRYSRSWGLFSSYLKISRFHFFVYLCASEILPLAILIKLFMRGWVI